MIFNQKHANFFQTNLHCYVNEHLFTIKSKNYNSYLDKFDAAESSYSEGGDDAEVVQLQSLELLVNAEKSRTVLLQKKLSIFAKNTTT